jgi:hypothetical protein
LLQGQHSRSGIDGTCACITDGKQKNPNSNMAVGKVLFLRILKDDLVK